MAFTLWHVPGAPSAEEWQAWWAFISALVTVVALIIAGVTAFYARGQLLELSASNRELSASNLELIRPRIVVHYKPHRMEALNYKDSFIDSLRIHISNTGPSPASNVLVMLDPPSRFIPLPQELLDLVRGARPFQEIRPGETLVYEVARFGRGTEVTPEELQQFTTPLTLSYSTKDTRHHFTESTILAMDHLAFARIAPEPLVRITKDIQNLTAALRDK
jgi:hypothetical protein